MKVGNNGADKISALARLSRKQAKAMRLSFRCAGLQPRSARGRPIWWIPLSPQPSSV